MGESSQLSISTQVMQNKFYIIKFDHNGNIISIFDRSVKREVLKHDSWFGNITRPTHTNTSWEQAHRNCEKSRGLQLYDY